MKKDAEKEVKILNLILQKDPEGKSNCIKLLSSTEHKGHACLIFEPMFMNLREILKNYGSGGISFKAVQVYARKIIIALQFLRKLNVIHCDLKLDNILVNKEKTVCKLADFGSAKFLNEDMKTPYLVSRFYRPPEIMLELQYDFEIDIWSLACCLFELYTDKILFPGKTNNEMLRLMIETKGPFPKKMIASNYKFFVEGAFLSQETDPADPTKVINKKITISNPTRDLRVELIQSTSKISEQSNTLIDIFNDFLQKCLILNPKKRLTASDALRHPFIQTKIQ
eukprot:TRINITY_DN4075_c2_g1_i2.p1 TRINITY_DN4075_c2_g1~~TRINITY_DN4075_c2_g1_i2.p1  ORF type:complete len:282 (+),score=82.88 TRINITY_DN4075_c2_g1_i2:280-1125(+)